MVSHLFYAKCHFPYLPWPNLVSKLPVSHPNWYPLMYVGCSIYMSLYERILNLSSVSCAYFHFINTCFCFSMHLMPIRDHFGFRLPPCISPHWDLKPNTLGHLHSESLVPRKPMNRSKEIKWAWTHLKEGWRSGSSLQKAKKTCLGLKTLTN